MAFPIAAAVGMGMQASGSAEARGATKEGAKAQADIDRLNRAFQEKMFGEEMARLQPRLDTATQQALPLFQRYMSEGGIGMRGDRPEFSTVVNPDYDPEQAAAYQDYLANQQATAPSIAPPTSQPAEDIWMDDGSDNFSRPGEVGGFGVPFVDEAQTAEASPFATDPYNVPETIQRKNMYLEDMPLYNMQADAGQDYLASQGFTDPYSTGRFTEGLGAAENDASYARLNDMLQIGMGASESAGQGAANFATGQANSLINTGNALAQGQMQAGNQRNSMYSNLAGQAGQIPAYMSMNQQQRPTNLQGPQMPLGGIR